MKLTRPSQLNVLIIANQWCGCDVGLSKQNTVTGQNYKFLGRWESWTFNPHISKMAVTLHYFTEFDKPVYQHITASICSGIYAQVYCIL